ncbi:hypothetical protein L1887_43283 [Cichorium endivia]|nr:hypothetical protein L1887_43283 [Cichorium endivia]
MSALSDSPASRSLRLRPAKKEPGSEEDYQDVSDHHTNDNRGSHPLRHAHPPNRDSGSISSGDSQETGEHIGDQKASRSSRSSSRKTFPVAIRRSGRNQSRSSSQAPTSSQTPTTSQSLRIHESCPPQPRRSTRRSGDSAPESSQEIVSEQMPSATQRLAGQTRAPSASRSSRRRVSFGIRFRKRLVQSQKQSAFHRIMVDAREACIALGGS